MLVEDGQVVMDDQGNPIRDFAFLPRYISLRPPGWLLEYWMRTDNRLTYKDIKARMTAPIQERPMDNTLNMRREREARWPLALSCWTTRRGHIARVEVERVERWTHDQIAYNTTMYVEYSDVTPESRKFCPVRLMAKALVPPEKPRYYPLGLFLEDDPGSGFHIPSQRITSAIDLFYRLSERVKKLGVHSWHFLPAAELPPSWKPIHNPRVYMYRDFEDQSGPSSSLSRSNPFPLPSGQTAGIGGESALASRKEMAGSHEDDLPKTTLPSASAVRRSKKQKRKQVDHGDDVNKNYKKRAGSGKTSITTISTGRCDPLPSGNPKFSPNDIYKSEHDDEKDSNIAVRSGDEKKPSI